MNNRILLALGNREAEQALSKRYEASDLMIIGTAIYKEVVLEKIETLNPNLVVILETLQGNDKTDIFDLVKTTRIKYPKTRIIFVATKRKIGDSKLSNLVSLAVYDIIANDTISLNEIADHIENPKTFMDATKYLPEGDIYTEEDEFEVIEVSKEAKEAIQEIQKQKKDPIKIKLPDLPKFNFERVEKTHEEIEADRQLKEAKNLEVKAKREAILAKKLQDVKDKNKKTEELKLQREREAEERKKQQEHEAEKARIEAKKNAELKEINDAKRQAELEIAKAKAKVEKQAEKEKIQSELDRLEKNKAKAKAEAEEKAKEELQELELLQKKEELKKAKRQRKYNNLEVRLSRFKGFVIWIVVMLLGSLVLTFTARFLDLKNMDDFIAIIKNPAELKTLFSFEYVEFLFNNLINLLKTFITKFNN